MLFIRLTLLILSLMLTTTAMASEIQASDDPLREALAEIEAADGQGRWFSYSIGMVGAATGVGLGAWILHARPLAENGDPDPVLFGSAVLLSGTAMMQLLHGAIRFDERGNSARTARRLIDDHQARAKAGRLFLEHRAAEARSTRFWGGVMTTAQGLGMTSIGLNLGLKGEDGQGTAGWVLTGLGALNIAVGVVHFFGKPRSERVLDKAVQAVEEKRNVSLLPTILMDENGQTVPGLFGQGRF